MASITMACGGDLMINRADERTMLRHISSILKDADLTYCNQEGPICEAGDILAHDVDLGEEVADGALLAIGEAGAYGLAMSSNYNGRLRPAQAVIDRGELRLSRRRETLDDLVSRDVE